MKQTTLAELGMKSSRCPITNELAPNCTRRRFDNFHISYARYIQEYGCDTTAIVLDGYHAPDLIEAAETRGIDGCIDIFVERISQVNKLSEHLMAVGIENDPFQLYQTTLEVIGLDNIEKIKNAVKNQTV
jgi:hypothetical protein